MPAPAMRFCCYRAGQPVPAAAAAASTFTPTTRPPPLQQGASPRTRQRTAAAVAGSRHRRRRCLPPPAATAAAAGGCRLRRLRRLHVRFRPLFNRSLLDNISKPRHHPCPSPRPRCAPLHGGLQAHAGAPAAARSAVAEARGAACSAHCSRCHVPVNTPPGAAARPATATAGPRNRPCLCG